MLNTTNPSTEASPTATVIARVASLGASQKVVILLCTMYVILYVDRVNIATAAPLIKSQLHLTNTHLGLTFSAFAVSYALFQLIGGWTSDLFGARIGLAMACAIVVVATLLTGAAGGFISLVVSRVLLGIGEGTAFPTASRALIRSTHDSRWGFTQGLTHGFARFGNALTPLLIAWMLRWMSWRVSFVIVALVTAVWICIWAVSFRDHPGTLTQSGSEQRQNVPWLRLARRMFPVTIVDFCYGWNLWLFTSWIPGFFYENYHLDLHSSALFSTAVFFSGFTGDLAGGWTSDYLLRRTGSLLIARRAVMVGGFLGAFLFFLPVIFVHNLAVATIFLSLTFFSAELIVGPIWAVPMDIAPQYVSSASGMMNFGFGAAGLVSPSSFGYLVDRTGSWVVPFVGSVVLLLLGAVLSARLRPDRRFE
jgi:MFS family permease